MARTIFATFDSIFSASKAVQDLHENGLSQDRVDVLTKPTGAGPNQPEWEESLQALAARPEIQVTAPQAGITIGIGIGGAVGVFAGLLAWLGELPMPTLFDPGPLSSAAVALTAVMASVLAGGITGGALGDLLKLGIPEEEMRQYARNVRDDKIVLAILADWDTVDPVIQLLTRHNPLSIEEKPYSRLKSNWMKRGGQARGVPVSRQEHEGRR